MTLEELRTEIQETKQTLASLRKGLRETSAQLRNSELEISVEVRHARGMQVVRKPHPALRRSREILSSIRAYEKTLKELEEREQQMQKAVQENESPFAKFRPKLRTVS